MSRLVKCGGLNTRPPSYPVFRHVCRSGNLWPASKTLLNAWEDMKITCCRIGTTRRMVQSRPRKMLQELSPNRSWRVLSSFVRRPGRRCMTELIDVPMWHRTLQHYLLLPFPGNRPVTRLSDHKTW